MYFKRFSLILLSILILSFLIIYIDPNSLIIEIKKIDMATFLIIFFLSNISIILRAKKWHSLLEDVKFKEIIPIQLLSISISNLTPGKFAEPIKAVLLKARKNIPVSKTLPSVILERILDIFILIVLSIIGIIIAKNYIYSNLIIISIILFIFILLLMILFILKKSFGVKLFKIFNRIKIFSFFSDKFIKTFYSSTKIKRRKIIISSVLTFFAWLIDGFIFYLIALSLDSRLTINFTPLLFCSIVSISILASLLTFLPGGIGSTEAILTYLLISIGFSKSSAGTITLIGRFATLGYSMILGYVSFVYLSKMMKIRVDNLIPKCLIKFQNDK